jgi:hypothetical protein
MMKLKSGFPAAIITAVLCFSGNLLAYSGGGGTTGNPYKIANVTDFNQLSVTSADWSKAFILTADINLTGLTYTKAPISPDTSNNTTGVFQGTKFTGVFDGNGHTISKLTINAPTQDFTALIGYVNTAGQIKNLGVVDVNITGRYMVSGLVGYNAGTLTVCYATGTVTGINDYVGGLVGWNISSITSCYATGSVSGDWDIGGLAGYNYGTISNCYAAGSATASSYTVGGLVGYNGYDSTHSGTILNSHATGNVIASFDAAGGLVGYNTDSSKISNCYATGAVSGANKVGGLVGDNDSNVAISNCHATGEVNGTGTDYYSVGGLVGENYYGIISRCYATGGVHGIQDVGGLVGQNWSGSILSCYATGTATGTSVYVGGLVGYNSADYGYTSTISNSYATGAASGTGGVGGLIGFNGYPSTTSYCYAAAAVTAVGAGAAGGLIGFNEYSTITACFWDTVTTGRGNGVGYVYGNTSTTGYVGEDTTGMKQQATFTGAGWDFVNETTNGTNDYWRMCVDAVDYPRLTWEYIQKGDFACPNGTDMNDLSYFVGRWLLSGCASSNNCGGADMDFSGAVDMRDYALLAAHWLEGI